jgi:hypothetical protein
VVRRVDSKRGDGGELRAFLLAEATALLGAFNGHPWPLDRPSTYEPTEDALDGPFGDVVRSSPAAKRIVCAATIFPTGPASDSRATSMTSSNSGRTMSCAPCERRLREEMLADTPPRGRSREFAKLSVLVVIEVVGTPLGLFTWVPTRLSRTATLISGK